MSAADNCPERLLIIAATGNAHKLSEFARIFGDLFPEGAVDVLSQKKAAELTGSAYCAPPEDGDSFAANAYIKASALENFMLTRETLRSYAAGYRAVCVIADDSGLCVDALGGAPGIYSARYAAAPGSFEDASDADNVDLLLKNLAGVPTERRTARFECHISALLRFGPGFESRVRAETAGDLKGIIAFERRGGGGFGYDPVMFLPERGMTVAELSDTEKNSISHRGKALRAAAEEIYGCFRKLCVI